MGQERHIELYQFTVKRDNRLIRWINVHDVGDPLHQQSTPISYAFQPVHCIKAIRVDACTKLKVLESWQLAHEKRVGDVYLCLVNVQFTTRVDDAVHGEHHGTCDPSRFVNLSRNISQNNDVALLFDLFHRNAQSVQVDWKFVA